MGSATNGLFNFCLQWPEWWLCWIGHALPEQHTSCFSHFMSLGYPAMWGKVNILLSLRVLITFSHIFGIICRCGRVSVTEYSNATNELAYPCFRAARPQLRRCRPRMTYTNAPIKDSSYSSQFFICSSWRFVCEIIRILHSRGRIPSV